MKPGRLRIAAAKILTEFFGLPIEPEHVVPVTGYWRSSPFADVQRWDVKVIGLMKGHPDHPQYFGCWEKLGDFVRDAKKYGVRFTPPAQGVDLREIESNEPSR